MAQTVQQSAHFSDLHPFIVGVNVAGLLVLLMLIGGRLVQLIRDWRKRVVGSRLEARMVWMSATLAMVPLLLVFYFSVMFLNRGIDSWFHVEIRQGLEDALTLSRAALDLRMREYMQRTRTIAGDLATHDDPVGVLDDARRRNEAVELTLFGANRRILGTSSERFGQIVPQRPNEEMVHAVAARIRDARSARRWRLPGAHRRAGAADFARRRAAHARSRLSRRAPPR